MVSEQDNGGVNPGQAIYDALSEEAKTAVDELQNGVLDGEGSQERARIFALSINEATDLGPNSWSLQSHHPGAPIKYLSLNVGNANMLKIGDRGEITVNTRAVQTADLLDRVEPFLLDRSSTSDER